MTTPKRKSSVSEGDQNSPVYIKKLMAALDWNKPERVVGRLYLFRPVFLRSHHRTDYIHILNYDIGFLVNPLEETQIVLVDID